MAGDQTGDWTNWPIEHLMKKRPRAHAASLSSDLASSNEAAAKIIAKFGPIERLRIEGLATPGSPSVVRSWPISMSMVA
jgi:hypothetical protein